MVAPGMISHPHKTIFIHIPKCAGQSIENAFLNDLGLTWQTRAPLLLRFNDQPAIGPKRLAHLLARDYVRHHYVSQELYDSYYKFAVVRDPWARAVSFYKYMNVNMGFDKFVLDWLPKQFERNDGASSYWFVQPQANYVTKDGKVIVDDIFKMEALSSDFPTIQQKAGLKSDLPHTNKSVEKKGKFSMSREELGDFLRAGLKQKMTILDRNWGPDRRDRHKDWKAYFNAETRKWVASLYQDDIDMFGYEFA